MPESRVYQEDRRVGKGVVDVVMFATDAPSKPTVEELVGYGYTVRAWSNRPRPSRPERKYLWKSVSARFPEALVPREYDSADDTDLGEGDARTTGFASRSRQGMRQYRRITTSELGLRDVLQERQPAATSTVSKELTEDESVNAPFVEGLVRPSVRRG